VSRETENAILFLVGVSTAIVAITGTYTRYVKPSLLPGLLAAAALLIVLAATSIARDVRHGRRGHDIDGHAHRPAIAWALLVPIVVLMFVVPPALAARGAARSVVAVSNDVLRRAFPPLPAGRAPTVPLPNVVARAANDTAGTLNDRLITIIGFTFKDAGATDLARVAITCCAADAQLARIHLAGGPAADAAALPEATWLRVEGVITPETPAATGNFVPTLNVHSLAHVDAPANPYAYNS
jgi:uncharacterized repeat protein (TIGR03943 family)